MSCFFFFFFFFSSRRRHTRSLCDWSSDVCSSDLIANVSAFWCRLFANEWYFTNAFRGGRGRSRQGTWSRPLRLDRKSTRLNSSHTVISYAVFCLKKKKRKDREEKKRKPKGISERT